MARTPTTLIPQTLTFLIEEFRVCEAEALVHLLAQGNGHAVWNPRLAAEWRQHLAGSGIDLGEHPIFPLLYVRNTQLPRAARSFRTYAADDTVAPSQRFIAFLEMLRLLWIKRQVPLAKYKGKLKRDRVNLITSERYQLGRDRLFAEGLTFLTSQGHPGALYSIAQAPEWIVYPVVREFLAAAGQQLAESGATPPWWLQVKLKCGLYSEDLTQLRALAERVDQAGFASDEAATLGRRYARQISRLRDLAEREAARAIKEAAYLDSIRGQWLDDLARLPSLERSKSQWEEYQDLRDHFIPKAIGTAEEILPLLPREATYTVWEVGAILPFVPQKQIRRRQLKGKVLKVNPDETVNYVVPCLEHYNVEEGLRRPDVTHYVIVRMKESAYALFDVAPKVEE